MSTPKLLAWLAFAYAALIGFRYLLGAHVRQRHVDTSAYGGSGNADVAGAVRTGAERKI